MQVVSVGIDGGASRSAVIVQCLSTAKIVATAIGPGLNPFAADAASGRDGMRVVADAVVQLVVSTLLHIGSEVRVDVVGALRCVASTRGT
jgi:hypothetical protein